MARRRKRRGGIGSKVALTLLAALALFVARRQSEAEPPVEPARPAASRAEPPPSASVLPFSSPQACQNYLQSHPRPKTRGMRIGSWNIRWFPKGTSNGKDPARRTDLAWLACAIAVLDVDVLAVQEITQGVEGRNALLDLLARLDKLTGGRWREVLDDCPGSGRQHVGFLFDSSRVTLNHTGMVAALNPGQSACDRNLRPGMRAYARFEGPSEEKAFDLWIVSVHLDAGVSARDYGHRAQILERLSAVSANLSHDKQDDDLLLLGDFNSMGCKECGEGDVSRSDEIQELDAALTKARLKRIALPKDQACTHYYKGHAGVLDHIAARVGMRELPKDAQVEVHGACRERACRRLSSRDPSPWLYQLSDHCPIAIELKTTKNRRSQAPGRGA